MLCQAPPQSLENSKLLPWGDLAVVGWEVGCLWWSWLQAMQRAPGMQFSWDTIHTEGGFTVLSLLWVTQVSIIGSVVGVLHGVKIKCVHMCPKMSYSMTEDGPLRLIYLSSWPSSGCLGMIRRRCYLAGGKEQWHFELALSACCLKIKVWVLSFFCPTSMDSNPLKL